MRGAARARVVLDDQVDRVVMETLFTSSPQLDVTDYLELSHAEQANGDGGDALILACATFTPAVSQYVEASRRLHPNRPVLLVCTTDTNGFVSEALEAGIDDIVTLPFSADPRLAQATSQQLMFTVEKAMARQLGERTSNGQKLGRMICVLGLKGGGGKTLVAANLAASLADSGHSVAVVDLDLQFGDVGLTLGMSPERTLYDLVCSGGSLDAEKLEDFLTLHPSGIRALLAPVRPDQAGVVTAEFLKDVYRLLRSMYEYVVIDTPPSFTPEVIGAVDASSDVCLVSMLDSLSLKNGKLGLETLELMDYAGPIRFVLNRADSNVGIAPEDVVAIMGRRPDVLVPSDRSITRSVNQGEPISLMHRRSEAARAFSALAGLYSEDPKAAGKRRRRRRPFRRAR